MPAPPLDALYGRLEAAAAAGDVASAAGAFHSLVGLEPRRAFAHLPVSEPVALVRQLVWAEPRRIDIAALLSGARDVAKFEDLSAARADSLVAEFQSRGLRTVRVGPYSKQFTVAVGSDAPSAGEALFTVIASTGDQAARVAEAEQDRSPEGTRAAGRALGYPECCIDHFLAVSASEEAERWGVNEAAIRAWPRSDALIPWKMNPLSGMSPIGFSACSPTCPHALAFADRLLDGLGKLDPRGRATLATVLSRPVLFFRYPLFFVFDGEPLNGPLHAISYRRALLNDDGSGAAQVLRRFGDEEFGGMFASGNEVEILPDALVVRSHGAKVARWALADASVPRLFRFTRE